MIEVLGLDKDPFWEPRVKSFHSWYSKSGSKTHQDAWTWEGKDSQKWSAKGTSKRAQSVPANPADRQSQAPAQSSAPSASSGIPVKAAPVSKNPGMANAPRNAPFSNSPGADPWAQHKPRSQ